MSAIEQQSLALPNAVEPLPCRSFPMAPDRAVGRHRRLGGSHHLSHRDRRLRVQSGAGAALRMHRSGGREHRSGPSDAVHHQGLAAVRLGAHRLRPEQRGGRHDRQADAVGVARRRRPVAVLRDDADRVAAGAAEASRSALVGGGDQQRLHVVLHPSLRGGRGAVAAGPRGMEVVRQAVRRAQCRGIGDLRGTARRTAMGGRPLHPGRHRRRPRQPAVHVQVGARRARRWRARRDAVHAGRRQQLDRADRRPRAGAT